MNMNYVPRQDGLFAEWDNQPMGCNGVSSGIFISDAVISKGLTQGKACDIIPPLKASALWSPTVWGRKGPFLLCP